MRSEARKMESPQFFLPDLPYPYDALEPYIDAETMKVHHTGHHAAYVEKLNKALAAHRAFGNWSLEDLLGGLDSLPPELRTEVKNNGGGHSNHSLFWINLTPNSTDRPQGTLLQNIETTFGSFENFQEKFTETAANHFSNGWAWLVADRNGDLSVKSTHDHDTPLSEHLHPLLVLDLWEHAYYLKHQNRRPQYIDAFWKIVDWNEVQNRWESLERL